MINELFSLQDKTCVVTGGSRGLGFAIARIFLEAGARRVYITARKEAACQEAAKELSEYGECIAIPSDLGKMEEIERFANLLKEKESTIDVLVNNAGIGGPRANIEDISYQEWDDCIGINLSGMFYCVKQVIPAMKAQGAGNIINISTGSAKTGLPFRLPYVASKVGVLGFTHNLARELGEYNIRCNTILPGLMDNPRGRGLVANYAEENGLCIERAEAEFLKYISLRSWIQPSEIADAAYFLASPAARHITAQELAVDGNCEWEQ